jgi:preprotein translocase subunit Sss1
MEITNKLSTWKIALLPAFGLMLIGLVGLVMPAWYADFYLPALVGQTWTEYHARNPQIADFILVLLQADGLGLLLIGMLSTCILVFACRRGERWGWLVLLGLGVVATTGDFVLEILAGHLQLMIGMGIASLLVWIALLV